MSDRQHSKRATPGTEAPTGTPPHDTDIGIVVNSGTVSFDDKEVTAGRIVVINDGKVSFTNEAALAAHQIVVNGGEVSVGGSRQPTPPKQDVPDSPAYGPHLRRVQ